MQSEKSRIRGVDNQENYWVPVKNVEVNINHCNIRNEFDKNSIYDEEEFPEMSVSSNESLLNYSPSTYKCSSDEEFFEILEGLNEKNDTFNESQFFKSITINSHRSLAELFLMSLKYSLNNRLPITGITNLLKFVNAICGKRYSPESTYRLDKLCNAPNTYTLHAVCPFCYKYLEIFEELNGSVQCDICDIEVDVLNPSNKSYFAMIDICDSVRDILETHEKYYEYIVAQRRQKKGYISDIYFGKLYRNFVKNLKDSDIFSYVIMIFNSDGAPVFKSLTVFIWLIYLILNEIPIQDRLKSTIICGLWFGISKPDMMVFLNVFVENMNYLILKEISCKISNQERKIKVFTLVACVDTVARAPMNGTNQFNAKYGCDWCLHQGLYHGGSMRYPYIIPPPNKRNKYETIQHAKKQLKRSSHFWS